MKTLTIVLEVLISVGALLLHLDSPYPIINEVATAYKITPDRNRTNKNLSAHPMTSNPECKSSGNTNAHCAIAIWANTLISSNDIAYDETCKNRNDGAQRFSIVEPSRKQNNELHDATDSVKYCRHSTDHTHFDYGFELSYAIGLNLPQYRYFTTKQSFDLFLGKINLVRSVTAKEGETEFVFSIGYTWDDQTKMVMK